MILCKNCGYEVNELDPKTEFCQTCHNAYELGFIDGKGE